MIIFTNIESKYFEWIKELIIHINMLSCTYCSLINEIISTILISSLSSVHAFANTCEAPCRRCRNSSSLRLKVFGHLLAKYSHSNVHFIHSGAHWILCDDSYNHNHYYGSILGILYTHIEYTKYMSINCVRICIFT